MSKIKNNIQKYKTLLVVATLLLVGTGIYANALGNAMFWDDQDSILNNSFIKDWSYFPKYFTENLIAGANLISNYWRPILLTVFALEWHLWGEAVQGYHAVNVLFHIGNALLAYFLLKKLFKKDLTAFIASFIFLIHPLQTEAVTYVSGLADPLSAFFILAGLIFYLKFKDSNKNFWASWPYVLSLFFFALALMTKEPAVVMPGLVLLVEAFSNSQTWKNKIAPLKNLIIDAIKNVSPFVMVAAIYLILRATILNFDNTFNVYGEANEITANLWYRLYVFFNAFVEYVRLLFVPTALHMERDSGFLAGLSQLKSGLGAAGVAALLTLAFSQFKKRPALSFGIFWFFLRLLPNANLVVPNSGLIYEHWLYLPMLGAWLSVAWFATEQIPAFFANHRKRTKMAAILVSLLFFVFLGVQTVKRNAEWQNPIRFYEQTLFFAPQSYRVINNLGMAYAEAKNYNQAESNYEKAIALDPNNPTAYHNLANVYRDTGRFELAEEYYKIAIGHDPNFVFSYHALLKLYLNLAEYYYRSDDTQKSIDHLKKAQELAPNEPIIARTIQYLEKNKE